MHAQRLGAGYFDHCRSCVDENEENAVQYLLFHCHALARRRLTTGVKFRSKFGLVLLRKFCLVKPYGITIDHWVWVRQMTIVCQFYVTLPKLDIFHHIIRCNELTKILQYIIIMGAFVTFQEDKKWLYLATKWLNLQHLRKHILSNPSRDI